jgi:hypothetical protein
MSQRKGAIQMSLGLIVAVVFAVILLSLLLSWVYGIFTPFEEITHKVTDVARQELLNRLAQGGGRVGIAAPAVTEWTRGQTGSFSLGIRNNDPATDKTYSINVYLEQLGGNLAGTSAASLQSEVASWLTFSSTEFVERGGSKSSNIIIKPDANAQTGIYLLRAVVCDAASCTDINSPNLYGSAQFAIEIKGL